jgi:MoxR-like ATPase
MMENQKEEKISLEDLEVSQEKTAGIERVQKCAEKIEKIKQEVGKAVVGQGEVIDGLIRALLCDGHVLLEGVPGLAKTLSIKALGQATGCHVKRIQFTVDLLPTDITGITTYNPEKGFQIQKGPIFANFIIADEINRSPPKTQSAMIEAMQENQVTIAKETHKLPVPFFVMATENPLETSGVYPLPEAQVDRFLFKLLMKYPRIKDEARIMEDNVTVKDFSSFNLRAVTSPEEIQKMQSLTKEIYLSKSVKKYILKIIEMTRRKGFKDAKYIEWGASPRATIGLFIASKAKALMEGRNYVVPKDVKEIAYDVLRHRLILSYRAGVEGITSDKIIKEILDRIKTP